MYNACNAAIRANLCGYSIEELWMQFLNNDAFGKTTSCKKKVVPPPSELQLAEWKKVLEPTRHMPGPARQWVLDTPRDIRDQVIKEISQAYKTGMKMHGSMDKFEVRFRSIKKLKQECITINSRDWGRHSGHFFHLFDSIRSSEPLPKMMSCEFDLIRTCLSHYYLCIPVDLEVRNENQVPDGTSKAACELVAIDPGVHTFITTFDLEGKVHEFGAGSIKRIKKICSHLDDLVSCIYKKKSEDNQSFVHGKKKRWRMRRAVDRMRRRIHNLVDETHHKVALWLCENYRTIYWPISGVSRMVAKRPKPQPSEKQLE